MFTTNNNDNTNTNTNTNINNNHDHHDHHYIHDYIHDYTGDNLDMLIDGIRILSEEGNIKNCNIIKIKLANIDLYNEEYSKAIILYDAVINTTQINLENKLNIENYIFNSMICRFLLGFSYQSINTNLNNYNNYIITFEYSDKYNLLSIINICLQTGDIDKFVECVNAYESVNTIDMLINDQLNKIKELISLKKDTNTSIDMIWQARCDELEKINIRLAKEIIELNEIPKANKLPNVDIFANLIADKIIQKLGNRNLIQF